MYVSVHNYTQKCLKKVRWLIETAHFVFYPILDFWELIAFRGQGVITGCLILLHPPNFLLEIRVIIKIESNPWYARIYETLQEWGKKLNLFWILKVCCFKKIQFFSLIPLNMPKKFLGSMDWIQFLWLLWYPAKH